MGPYFPNFRVKIKQKHVWNRLDDLCSHIVKNGNGWALSSFWVSFAFLPEGYTVPSKKNTYIPNVHDRL